MGPFWFHCDNIYQRILKIDYLDVTRKKNDHMYCGETMLNKIKQIHWLSSCLEALRGNAHCRQGVYSDYTENHSFNNYLLSICYAPGTVLGADGNSTE